MINSVVLVDKKRLFQAYSFIVLEGLLMNRSSLLYCIPFLLLALTSCVHDQDPGEGGVVSLTLTRNAVESERPIAALYHLETDEEDNARFARAAYRALEMTPTNSKSKWTSRSTRAHGYVMPTSTTRNGSSLCRRWVAVLSGSGKSLERTGEACRSHDGAWKFISE